jgi:hypothetical protein
MNPKTGKLQSGDTITLNGKKAIVLHVGGGRIDYSIQVLKEGAADDDPTLITEVPYWLEWPKPCPKIVFLTRRGQNVKFAAAWRKRHRHGKCLYL